MAQTLTNYVPHHLESHSTEKDPQSWLFCDLALYLRIRLKSEISLNRLGSEVEIPSLFQIWYLIEFSHLWGLGNLWKETNNTDGPAYKQNSSNLRRLYIGNQCWGARCKERYILLLPQKLVDLNQDFSLTERWDHRSITYRNTKRKPYYWKLDTEPKEKVVSL